MIPIFRVEVERVDEKSHVRIWVDDDLTGCLVMLHDQADVLCALINESQAIANAAGSLLYSLGEYVRQSMDMNPEWRSGIRAVESLTFLRKKRLHNPKDFE